MPAQRLNCSFSLLDEGRQYTGNHRKYIIENAREICNSPATKEKIRLREALGFYGHGRRILAGKMNIGEVEAVTLPDGGKAIVSNIPSNVTVAFDVSPEGVVSHSQEVLDTETGKIVSTLHASRVGGFSWACPGVDGGRGKPTRLSGFSGFDYVLNPGFSSNRGYILEGAADTAGQEQMILECLAATVKDDRKAEEYLAGWKLDTQARLAALEDAIFESTARQAELTERLRRSRRNRLHLKGPMRVRHSGSRSAEGTACRVDRRARLLFPLLYPGRCTAPDDGGGLFPRQNDFRAGVPRGLLAISH
ncbi:MAG: hypothetical protein ACLUPV_04500 [Bilophila wadsworthia]